MVIDLGAGALPEEATHRSESTIMLPTVATHREEEEAEVAEVMPGGEQGGLEEEVVSSFTREMLQLVTTRKRRVRRIRSLTRR